MEVVIRFGLLAWLVWQWKSQGKGKVRVWHVLKGKHASGFSRVTIEQQVAGENRMADKACVLELSWEKYICGAVREIKETMRTVSPANISFANRYGTGSLGAPSRRPGVRVTLCEREQRGLGRHNALSHPNFECEQFIEAPAPPPAQVIHFKFSVTFCVSNGPTHLRLLPQACAKKKFPASMSDARISALAFHLRFFFFTRVDRGRRISLRSRLRSRSLGYQVCHGQQKEHCSQVFKYRSTNNRPSKIQQVYFWISSPISASVL